MRIPDSVLDDIIAKTDIVQVLGKYVTLKNKGGRWWGLCPFHNEKTPSFSVNPEKGLFYCFGCHKGGTIISFIMEKENLSFLDTVKYLAEKAGVSLPEKGPGDQQQDAKYTAMFELYARITESMHYILLNSRDAETARNYLNSRGISRASIDNFRLGYIPDKSQWLYSFLRNKKYSDEFLRDSGLFSRKNPVYTPFRDRIIFPIFSVNGRVSGFGGRALGNKEPKYYNSPESVFFKKRENLFGLNLSLNFIKKEGSFIVVEGYFDLIHLFQNGIQSCIAPLGTAFTEKHAMKMKRYVSECILLFDGDEAGRRAAKKTIIICEKAGITSKVVVLPENLDPADYLQKYGQEALKKLLKYPINSFEYLLKEAEGEFDFSIFEEKERFLHSLIPYVDAIQSEIKKESCIQIIAEKLQVQYSAVIRDIGRLRKRGPDTDTIEVQHKEKAVSTELFLLLAVAAHREYFNIMRSSLGVEDFQDKKARELFIALEECFRNDEITYESLLARISSEDLRNLVISRTATEEFSVNLEKIIHDTIQRMLQRRIEKKRRHILNLLRKYEEEGEHSQEVIDLLNEKIFYDKELEKLRISDNG